MTFTPILEASLPVQIHLASAILALMLGPFAIWRRRRDRLHKALGYAWVTSMLVASTVSFAIPTEFAAFGLSLTPFQLGPIHLLSVNALWGVCDGMRAIFRNEIALHQRIMKTVYLRGLVLAGAFTFLPGRLMQKSLIPDMPMLGYVVISVALLWVFAPLVLACFISFRTSQPAE